MGMRGPRPAGHTFMSSCAFANANSLFTESITAFLRVSMSVESCEAASSVEG